MTDFFQTVSLSIFSPLRCTPLSKSHWLFFISGTLERRVFQDPTLRKSEVAPIRSRPLVPCMGFFETLLCLGKASELALLSTSATLLRFSLSEAVEKSVCYCIRAIIKEPERHLLLLFSFTMEPHCAIEKK